MSTYTQGSPSSWPLASTGLGLISAATVVAVLQASYVWMGLMLVGLLTIVGSFLFRDRKLYWFTVFLLTIPLNISKMFYFEPADVERLKSSYGLFINEIIVPLLHLSDLPLLVLLGIWAGEIALHRRRIRVPGVVVLAAAFALWCALTVLSARAPWLGWVWLLYQVKYVLIVLWIVNASFTKRDLRVILAALVFNLAAQASLVICTYKFQLGSNFYGRLFGERGDGEGPARHAGEGYVFETGDLLRGSGTVGVGNETAKFLVPLLPLSLVCGIFSRRALYRVLSFGVCGLGLIGIYFTFSRGGLLTGLLSFGVLVVLLAKRGLIGRKALVAMAAAGLLSLSAATPFLYRHMTSRPGFFDLRLKHVSSGAGLLVERPLWGVGVNNFNVSLSRYDYGGIFASMPIHNHYLRLGIETGLVGLTLYVVFFMWVGVLGYRAMWSADVFLASAAIALLAGLVATMVYWTDDLFYGVVVSTQFWTMSGLILVLYGLAEADLSPVKGRDPSFRKEAH